MKSSLENSSGPLVFLLELLCGELDASYCFHISKETVISLAVHRHNLLFDCNCLLNIRFYTCSKFSQAIPTNGNRILIYFPDSVLIRFRSISSLNFSTFNFNASKFFLFSATIFFISWIFVCNSCGFQGVCFIFTGKLWRGAFFTNLISRSYLTSNPIEQNTFKASQTLLLTLDSYFF